MQQATSRLTMLHILVGWCTCTREKRPYCDFSANIPFFSISPPSTKLHIIFYTHHNTIPERLKEKRKSERESNSRWKKVLQPQIKLNVEESEKRTTRMRQMNDSIDWQVECWVLVVLLMLLTYTASVRRMLERIHASKSIFNAY